MQSNLPKDKSIIFKYQYFPVFLTFLSMVLSNFLAKNVHNIVVSTCDSNHGSSTQYRIFSSVLRHLIPVSSKGFLWPNVSLMFLAKLMEHCEIIKSHSKLTHYYSNIEFVAFLQQFFLVFLDKFFNLAKKKRQIKSNQKVPEMSVILILSISNGIINPLHPNISRHILHTARHTFLKVLTRRICLVIKSFFC